MEENQVTQNNLNQQPVQPVQPQPEQVQQQPQETQQEQQVVQQAQPQAQQPAQPQVQPVQTAQQPVQQQIQQPVQQQTVQTTQQPAQPANQASVSMQIQELLVKQQQYQQQYNQLVDYVKKTPNLPIEQVNQIKLQLDQLNLLFVQGKQKLQELGYNQVQVNKSVEVKKGSSNNFSFRKVAIGCIIVVIFILVGLFITIASLIKNPQALLMIGIGGAEAKQLIQAFTVLIFGSVILLMIGVIISSIYKLVTVKNQSRGKTFLSLLGGIFGAGIMGALMGLTFKWIGTIVTEVEEIEYDVVQPYIVGRVEKSGEDEFNYPYKDESIIGIGEKYPLVAPAEMSFAFRWDEFEKLRQKNLKQDDEIVSIKLLCGNNDNKELEGTQSVNKDGWYIFDGTCLYPEKGEYTYSIAIVYDTMSKERLTQVFPMKTLNFTSSVSISKTVTETSYSNNKPVQLHGENSEFNVGSAPAKISIDSRQVFSDFGLTTYTTEWDMDGDFVTDRENQSMFDFTYKIPKVYYVTYKIPGLREDLWYRFPVRVEQSDRPVCSINASAFGGTTKYQISSEFVDPADAGKISSYNYTITNLGSKEVHQVLKDYPQEFNYTFPDKGSYRVVLDYVTIDGKQGQCESDTIQLKKETFNIQYSMFGKEGAKFKEICSSNGEENEKCTKLELKTFPQTYQLQLQDNSDSNTLKKVVLLNDTAILNENDTYTFDITEEGDYVLEIKLSDVSKGMDEETREIKIAAYKPDIVGKLYIMSNEKDYNKRKIVSEGFEPLEVILDASKTEINVEGDEIVYFTWDFGDGEIKKNQQNGVVAHTYHYDYENENGIFQPKVTVTTREGLIETISDPKINVKKGLTNIELNSPSHPSRQAPVGTDITFSAEFDGLPEKMIWDFGDGSATITCEGRTCTEISHIFKKADIYSVKLSLEFDAVQQVDSTMDFKAY